VGRRTRKSTRTSRTEHGVLASLRARERDLVELARELIATPSPNPPGDEREVARIARQAMAELGFARVRTLARDEARPNVVGEVGGEGGQSLVLNGHLDTKPPGAEAAWEIPPYDPVVRDGKLHGLGSTDMKGSAAAMIHAGAALAEAGSLPGKVGVVLSADEEAGSRYGAAWLASSAEIPADAVLVGEPTGLRAGWEYIAVASRGFSAFRVRVRGTQMHSSLSDRLPSVNASVKMARALVRFADEFQPTWTPDPRVAGAPTVNLGVVVRGGVFYGVYPGEAEFGVDVRTVPGMTLERLRSDVEAFLGRLRDDDRGLDIEAEWEPDLAWFPPCAISPDDALLAAAESAAEAVLGRRVPRGLMPAFTDGTHWALAGKRCIPAFGPGLLPLAHRPNEYVSVEEVLQASRVFALTALRYLGR
jgi:acetylornithine deacetylase/succinyl-diaminopimelate desuccinylase-like protein